MGSSLDIHEADQDRNTDPTGSLLCCEKCGAVGQDTSKTWCKECGYYAVIGNCVPLTDEDQGDAHEGSVQSQVAPSYFGIFKLIPGWIWGLFFLIALLLVSSLAANLLLTKGSSLHVIWSVAQFVIGILIFGAAHIQTYLNAMLDDSRLSISDIILRPFVVWESTFARLPASSRRVQAAVLGVTATLFSIAIVGGLPYHLLWSWGPNEEQTDPNLLAAISQMAPEAEDNGGDLSDSIEDFADKTGAQDLLDNEPDQGEPTGEGVEAEEPKEKIDCLILGYREQGEDDFSSLIIAGNVEGSIRVIGTVSEGISTEDKQKMFERMAEIRQDTPFIPCGMKAIWIEPLMLCRVHFSKWNSQHWLEKPVFGQLLDEVKR